MNNLEKKLKEQKNKLEAKIKKEKGKIALQINHEKLSKHHDKIQEKYINIISQQILIKGNEPIKRFFNKVGKKIDKLNLRVFHRDEKELGCKKEELGMVCNDIEFYIEMMGNAENFVFRHRYYGQFEEYPLWEQEFQVLKEFRYENDGDPIKVKSFKNSEKKLYDYKQKLINYIGLEDAPYYHPKEKLTKSGIKRVIVTNDKIIEFLKKNRPPIKVRCSPFGIYLIFFDYKEAMIEFIDLISEKQDIEIIEFCKNHLLPEVKKLPD